MPSIRLALSLLFFVAACASRSRPPATPKELTLSPREAVEALSQHDEAATREALARHGIAYVVHGAPERGGDDSGEAAGGATPKVLLAVAPEPIEGCSKQFPAELRNAWHQFNGEWYFIDKVGRPEQAYSELPPIATEARSNACQRDVGRWGDDTDTGDYDGGHMIGSQLGGYGRRLNMVPQIANFNRGNWLQLENGAAHCAGLASRRLIYWVGVSYAKASDIVPKTMSLYLEDTQSGDFIELTFENKPRGGSHGTGERKRGVEFLKRIGCLP